MEDPADYLASKYKYIFRVPGAQRPTILAVASAGVIGILAGQFSGNHFQSLVYSLAGLAGIPLLLSLASINIFRGLPLHSTFRRLCQLTLLSNYLLIGALLLSSAATALRVNIMLPLISAALGAATYIRLTFTWMIDGERGASVAAWSLIEPSIAAIFISSAVGSAPPNVVLVAPLTGASLAAITLIYLGLPDRDGVSSVRLARGFSRLMLEGNPRPLEEELYRFGKMGERFTEAFVFRGKESGRLSALIILPFHMGPLGRMGSAMLNWLIESEAAKRGVTAVAVKGCTTHVSDIISSQEAERIAHEVADRIRNFGDGWSDTVGLWSGVKIGKAEGLMLEMAGRRMAVVSLHPHPMEDIPEEMASFTDELNISLIDPHNSFSPNFKKLSPNCITDIKSLLKNLSGKEEDIRGSLKVSIERTGFGKPDPRKGVGPCGYSLITFTVGAHNLALCVVDGNNAMPWVRDEVKRHLLNRGWHTVELLTTDTHSVNGVVLGGRGYFPVGEKMTREEILAIVDELASRSQRSLEESEVTYFRIRHDGVRLFTEELFEKMAARVRLHVLIYLAGLIGSSVLGFIMAAIL